MKGINDRFQDMVRQKDLLDLKENSGTSGAGKTTLATSPSSQNDCWNENYNDWINPSCPLEAAAPGNGGTTDTQGLGDALEPIIKKEGLEASTSSSSLTPQQAAEIDKKARSTIILSLGDSVIREVARERTVADLWAKLERVYMTKSLANRLYIKKRMFTLKMAEGSSLEDHIDEFNKVCDTLEIIDEGLDDEDCPELKNKKREQNGAAATVEEEVYESAGVCVATEHVQKGMLDQMGLSIKLKFVELRISNGDGVVMKGYKRNGIYVLNGEAIIGLSGVSISSNCDNTLLWHLRLRHMSLKGLKELQKQGVLGSSQISELDFCEDCVLGKATRNSFGKSVHSTKGILEYIHSDLWGPAQTISLGGNTYFLSLIDDYSRRVWVYVLKHKDQVFGKFRDWKSLVENQTGLKVKKLRTDNGLEFCNQEFDSYCADHGIVRHRTAETLLTTNYLVNLSPSTALDFKTPFEKWHGKPAYYGSLKVFGCPAYANVSQGKLAPRALKRKFIGYPEGVKGFKLWCTDLNPPKCIISRDVIFNEKVALEMKKSTDTDAQKDKERTKVQFEVEPYTREASEDKNDSYQGVADQETDQVKQTEAQHQEYQLTRDRERRKAKTPVRYGYADLIAYILTTSHQIDKDEPKNYKEAIQGPYKDEWKKAMDEEIYSLKKNNTWELVKRPANSRTVKCKWIYIVKDGLTATEPRRFKAKVLLTLTAVKDIELDQLDVKTAFLHGRLNEDILMIQPEGYTSPESADCVCLLKRSLYGLKQPPRQWYLRFDEFIVIHEYLRCSYDVCVYYKIINSGNYIYLLLYVDDMLIACSEREEIKALKQLLNSEFDMKDLGPARKILGMKIIRNMKKGTMILSQRKYLKKVLGTFGMTSSKSVVTPLASHFKLSRSQCPSTDEEMSEMTKVPYANVVGCMMYAIVLTRPDLAHSLSVVSRFMATPGKEHCKAVKWVLRYLKGTQEYGLVYGRSAGKASLQHVVALSTTEAEYTAATEAVKEALWLRGLITELGIKNVISKCVISMVKVHTDDNPADMLTKALILAAEEWMSESYRELRRLKQKAS
ncbi:Integrase catalytic domain-containing protein [Citrus sinensis]|nr:Integrase catalytic domain-containing protein [Citrus sinensis]